MTPLTEKLRERLALPPFSRPELSPSAAQLVCSAEEREHARTAPLIEGLLECVSALELWKVATRVNRENGDEREYEQYSLDVERTWNGVEGALARLEALVKS